MLFGAHNSGVILSQIFKGFCNIILKAKKPADIAVLLDDSKKQLKKAWFCS